MKKLILTAMVALAAISANAIPAKRGPYKTFSADGTEILVQRIGDEHGSWFLDMEGNLLRRAGAGFEYARIESDGTLAKSLTPIKFSRSLLPAAEAETMPAMRRAAPAMGLFPGSSFPAQGKQKALVVLVEFQDTKFKLGNDAKQYFTDMLNKEGFSEYKGTGCASEYFREMSSGKFDCQFDVYGPITLKNNYKYYGGSDDRNAYKMAIEACEALDPDVNFADYDRDNDGSIDNIFIFYAGEGEATAYPENANLVWPHAWNVTAAESTKYRYDGKLLDSYGCTNEWISVYEQTRTGKYTLIDQYPDGVGTFVHEFSHILGLPDLYLTDENELSSSEEGYFTPGEWSVMDYGPYNNNGRTPPAYSAFERNALGWMTTEELTADTENPSLTAIEESNHAYSICNPIQSGEFYLLECRKRSGWDTYIPGDGMLVWHIDYNNNRWIQNSVNNKGSHQYVDLIEADGVTEKRYRNAGDCFPGTKKVTELSTKWWDKTSTGIKLSDITLNADKTISFSVNATGANADPSAEWLTVADVIDSPMNDEEAKVRGYIVGYVKSGTFSSTGVSFSAGSVNTNIVLAELPTENDVTNCIPVQLVKSSDARSDLNLSDHPENLGKKVEVHGTLSLYMQVPALKNVKTYRFISEQDNTAIEEVTAVEPSTIYDLQGRAISSPRHGQIYILNGKKIKL